VQAVLIENATLKSEMAALKNQLGELIEAVKAREVPMELRSVAEKVEITKRGAESPAKEEKVAAPSVDNRPLIAEFQMLNKEKFGEWVMQNLDRIQSNDFPLDVRQMIEQKWARLIQGDFPVPLG